MSKGIVLSLCDYSGAWSRPFIALGYTVVRVDPMHDAGRATTEGTTLAGSFAVSKMTDGGYALAATAGQLADVLEGRDGGAMRFIRALDSVGERRNWCDIVGVLMAPPCTHFAGSGARWWAGKDARGETDAAVQIVRDCLRVKDAVAPRWWALENPVGRIARLVPELRAPGVSFMAFDPCDYALLAEDDHLTEAYTKRTCLWGKFNANHLRDLAERVEPVMFERTRKDGTKVRGSWMWANLGGKSERTKALRSKTPTGFARAFAAAQEG